jgi:hypothetical protein
VSLRAGTPHLGSVFFRKSGSGLATESLQYLTSSPPGARRAPSLARERRNVDASFRYEMLFALLGRSVGSRPQRARQRRFTPTSW